MDYLSKAKRKKDGSLWSGKWLEIKEIRRDPNTEKFHLLAKLGITEWRSFKLGEFEEFRFSAFELDNILNKRQPKGVK
tara:strand:+ start:444 stop:677 length:234 start_codon:yes stop_codon:yes gene_type:complete